MTPTPSLAIDAVVAATSAPWWGVPVIAGGFLLAGAVLGFLFNRINEKQRIKHDNETRWHQDIRVLIAELIEASQTMMETETEVRDNARLGRVMDPENSLRIHNATITSLKMMKVKSTELLLIASKSLHKKAMQYMGLAMVSNQMIANGGSADEIHNDVMQRQLELTEAFRKEMLIEPNKKRFLRR